MFKGILKSRRGEGYIDVAIGILCLMLVVALAVSFLPVFTTKQQLDLFAAEIVREAEIVGGHMCRPASAPCASRPAWIRRLYGTATISAGAGYS